MFGSLLETSKTFVEPNKSRTNQMTSKKRRVRCHQRRIALLTFDELLALHDGLRRWRVMSQESVIPFKLDGWPMTPLLWEIDLWYGHGFLRREFFFVLFRSDTKIDISGWNHRNFSETLQDVQSLPAGEPQGIWVPASLCLKPFLRPSARDTLKLWKARGKIIDADQLTP